MGWNSGYTTYESTVINAYDTGALTKELLNSLMQPYHGSDIDHGGCKELRSNGGLSADEVVCEIMKPEKYADISGIPSEMPLSVKLVDGKYIARSLGALYKYDSWQQALQDERDCAVYDLWREIVRREWEIG